MIIGISGRAGSGKTTAATYLSDVLGFSRTKFADPLKSMARIVGLTDRHLEGDLKEFPCDLIGGKTPRFFLQALGTEFGRNMIDDYLWVKIWMRNARFLLDEGKRVVADDVRFPNEVAAIKALGGYVIRIRTHDPAPAGDHISEQHDLPYDVSVLNDGPVEVFHSRLDGALEKLGGDYGA